MDVSSMYIPNSSKWIEFYRNSLKGHLFNGRNRNQKGGSLVSGAKTIISPIEYGKSTPTSKMEIDEVPVKIISPAQAAVELASTEIDRMTHVKRRHKTKKIRLGNKRRRLKTKSSKNIRHILEKKRVL